MPDYQKMYFQLFNAMTDAVQLLEKAQLAGEEAYLQDETAQGGRAEQREAKGAAE